MSVGAVVAIFIQFAVQSSVAWAQPARSPGTDWCAAAAKTLSDARSPFEKKAYILALSPILGRFLPAHLNDILSQGTGPAVSYIRKGCEAICESDATACKELTRRLEGYSQFGKTPDCVGEVARAFDKDNYPKEAKNRLGLFERLIPFASVALGAYDLLKEAFVGMTESNPSAALKLGCYATCALGPDECERYRAAVGRIGAETYGVSSDIAMWRVVEETTAIKQETRRTASGIEELNTQFRLDHGAQVDLHRFCAAIDFRPIECRTVGSSTLMIDFGDGLWFPKGHWGELKNDNTTAVEEALNHIRIAGASRHLEVDSHGYASKEEAPCEQLCKQGSGRLDEELATFKCWDKSFKTLGSCSRDDKWTPDFRLGCEVTIMPCKNEFRCELAGVGAGNTWVCGGANYQKELEKLSPSELKGLSQARQSPRSANEIFSILRGAWAAHQIKGSSSQSNIGLTVGTVIGHGVWNSFKAADTDRRIHFVVRAPSLN